MVPVNQKIKRLEDADPVIQLQAARALAGMGMEKEALPVVRRCLGGKSETLVLQAALVVDECNLLEIDPDLSPLLKKAKGSYTRRVVGKLIGDR